MPWVWLFLLVLFFQGLRDQGSESKMSSFKWVGASTAPVQAEKMAATQGHQPKCCLHLSSSVRVLLHAGCLLKRWIPRTLEVCTVSSWPAASGMLLASMTFAFYCPQCLIWSKTKIKRKLWRNDSGGTHSGVWLTSQASQEWRIWHNSRTILNNNAKIAGSLA